MSLRPRAHYHDGDPTPITGGWACYCEHPNAPERPDDWKKIRAEYRADNNYSVKLESDSE